MTGFFAVAINAAGHVMHVEEGSSIFLRCVQEHNFSSDPTPDKGSEMYWWDWLICKCECGVEG